MSALSAVTLLSDPKEYKIRENRVKTKTKVRGSGFGAANAEDEARDALKQALQAYDIFSGADQLAGRVVKIVGIENMNMHYLAATLYLYETYREDFRVKKDITSQIRADMFEDTALAMIKIRDKIEKLIKPPPGKTNVWVSRKVVILNYFQSVLLHFSETEAEYEPSFAVKQSALEQQREEAEQEEEDRTAAQAEEEQLVGQVEEGQDEEESSKRGNQMVSSKAGGEDRRPVRIVTGSYQPSEESYAKIQSRLRKEAEEADEEDEAEEEPETVHDDDDAGYEPNNF